MVLDSESQRELLLNILDEPALRVPAPLVRQFVALLEAVAGAAVAPEPDGGE